MNATTVRSVPTFSKVIVGVDGGPGTRDAIALATALVVRGGKLFLAHVGPDGASPTQGGGEASGGHELLEAARSAAGIDATLLTTRSRSVGRGLHELAEAHGCDLLVVGACSRGFLERATRGDDTRAALNGADWAVAIAPAAYADHPSPFTEIGVGYDGSSESVDALAVARDLAASHGARVSAFEAVTIRPDLFDGGGVSFGEAINATIAGARTRIEALGDVEPHVAFGPAAEELALYSASVDLLVVGSHGYGPLGRLVHGSTSNELARSARCPLIVVRAGSPSGGAQATTPPVGRAGP